MPDTKLIKKICKIVFLVSLGIFIVFSFYKTIMPGPSEISKEIMKNDPKMENTALKPFIVKAESNEYEIIPRADYELYAMITSTYDAKNMFNAEVRKDSINIKDLCVIWGENNVKNNAYQKTKFKSEDFACWTSWDPQKFPEGPDTSKISNNHLIAQNNAVGRKINGLQIGDQIHIKGYLVDYRIRSGGRLLFTRDTSLDPHDFRHCEIIYVTGLQILKKANRLPLYARKISLGSGIASFLILAGLFLSAKPEAKKRDDF